MCVQFQVSETIIHSQEEELQQHQLERDDQVWSMPDLHQRQANAVQQEKRRSSASSFDGQWVLIEGDNVALWLHSFKIQGKTVIAADGEREVLEMLPGGETRLCGGRLSIENEILCRTKRNRTLTKYRRCKHKPSDAEQPMQGDLRRELDDGETCTDIEWASSSNLGNLCDLDDLEVPLPGHVIQESLHTRIGKASYENEDAGAQSSSSSSWEGRK